MLKGICMDAPLNFNAKNNLRLAREESEHSIPLSEVVEQLTGFVRRQYPIFVFFIACSLCLGLVYLVTTPPSFTAHTMLLIDSSKVRMLQEQGPIGDVPIDTAQVETQVEILKSENIGATVVKDLKLSADPEFTGSGAGLLGRILALVTAPEPKSETGLAREALGAFLAKRTVTRVGRTYVLDIGFTASSPARAAEIANAIADAYIETEAANLMRFKACCLFDAGQPCGAEANMAKYLAAKASWEAANACLQFHGGFGFACEYDVERKFRETRLYQVAPISTNLILSYVAEHVLGLPRSF